MVKTYNISLIPGDGIGPEITDAMKFVLKEAGFSAYWEEVEAGESAIEKYKTPLPSEVIDSIKKNKIAIKGPTSTPIGTGFRSVNVALRKELDLYVCLRPCRSIDGVKSNFSDIDLVVVRENTEDLYMGVEFSPDTEESNEIIKMSNNKILPHSAISIKSISRENTERIVKFAFDYALKNDRKKVTAVTKANIMKATDGLFLEVAREVSKRYSNIEYEEKLIDNMCMQLVQKPEIYDVIVLPNLYGDILSDLCAGLIGGLGVAPGANIGKDIAVFEPTHGSAPKYKGMNKINPVAMILSSTMMLDYLGEKEISKNIKDAVKKVIKDGRVVTYDLGGVAKTMEMAEEIVKNLQ